MPHKTNNINKGHPLRIARRTRAAERAAVHVCNRTCKRFRTGKAKWPSRKIKTSDGRVIDHLVVTGASVMSDGTVEVEGIIVQDHMVAMAQLVGHYHGPHWHAGPCVGGVPGDLAPF
jgi:hypothetical protein